MDEPGSSATPDHAVSNGVNISTDPVPTSAPRSSSGSNHSPVRSQIYLMKLQLALFTSARVTIWYIKSKHKYENNAKFRFPNFQTRFSQNDIFGCFFPISSFSFYSIALKLSHNLPYTICHDCY